MLKEGEREEERESKIEYLLVKTIVSKDTRKHCLCKVSFSIGSPIAFKAFDMLVLSIKEKQILHMRERLRFILRERSVSY